MEIKKLAKSQIEIVGEISADNFGSFWDKAVAKLSQSIKIDGFRSGHIPEDILVKNVGEAEILDTAAELALRVNYSKIILDNKINAIGRPIVKITKIAKGNPLGFTIIVAIIPEIKLPDYKNIAKKIFAESLNKEIIVTDKEIEDLTDEIRRSRADKTKPEEIPALDDDLVKTLGEFKNLEDFKEKMRENLKFEKESSAKEASRLEVIEKINQVVEMELPDVLIENEIDRGISQMKTEVEREGLNFDEYLKGIKKSSDDIRKESRIKAEKSVRYNLILKNLARIEGIVVPAEEVLREAEKLVKMYAGADLESAKIYVEDILVNNKVFQFLEN